MIFACLDQKVLGFQEITAENYALLEDAIWIDVISPTKAEEILLEKSLAFAVPTREDMVEIELSSRLYKEDDILFMTALMIANSASAEPEFDPVTFILTPQQLITIRYIDPQAFKLIAAHLKKHQTMGHDALALFMELLDASVDRLADILELVARHLDDYSKYIFKPQEDETVKLDYRKLMQSIGSTADLNAKARESLVTFNRLIAFCSQMAGAGIDNAGQIRLASLVRDIQSLSDHANFISSKINFLLDATLGMVNIEQNNIIKIFSVAAVIFLPPTLIASIYGMNFHFMPELRWKYGYIFAIGMILVAAWLPYKYFKYRKWL